MTSAGTPRSGARYGARPTADSSANSTSSITNKAIVLVFAAMFIAAIIYGVQYFQKQEKVNADISYVTHEVLSDDSTRVWADVTRNHIDEDAYCRPSITPRQRSDAASSRSRPAARKPSALLSTSPLITAQ